MSGPNLSAMAWRNIWRQRRRTLLTMSSIAFGTMCAVVFTGTCASPAPRSSVHGTKVSSVLTVLPLIGRAAPSKK